jgi:hypothetical protein
MLPQTVGELRKLLAELPDNMPFELDLHSEEYLESVDLGVKSRQVGYDGKQHKPRMADCLTLSLRLVL